MIAMIAAIAERFFDLGGGSDHMETRLKCTWKRTTVYAALLVAPSSMAATIT